MSERRDPRREANGGRKPLGEASEDGLKAIFKLTSSGRRVSTSALAAQLEITEPSATALIKRLARLGLVDHAPYHGVELTPSGEKVALEIIRHHRLLELYLVEALGLSWDKVHAEAERLEHVVSEELEDRIDAVLGYPAADPHGDPIPTRDGRLEQPAVRSLADLDPGQQAIILIVPDGDPELLQYLAELGLFPGVRVELLEKAPFGGPIALGVEGKRKSVGRELAATIRVGQLVKQEALNER